MKKRFITATLGVFTMVSLFAQSILNESFENYGLGSFPSKWTLQYNGTGTINQKVVNTVVKNGLQSLQLEGAESWTSEIFFTPDNMPDSVVLDCWFYIDTQLGGATASFGLGNYAAGTWGSRTSRFQVIGTNFIATYQPDGVNYVLCTYQPKVWYHLKMDHNLKTRKYSVYLNDSLMRGTYNGVTYTEFPMHPTYQSVSVMLGSGNFSTVKTYIDDVKLDGKSASAVKPLSHKNVGLQIWPNPSSGLLTMKLSKELTAEHLFLYATDGWLVFQTNWNGLQKTFDLEFLKNGIYLVKIGDEFQKLSIQK